MEEVLSYFPESIRENIKENAKDKLDKIEEIRLRLERPIILKFDVGEKVIKASVSTEEIISCLQAICENSIYTYQNQIANGFVTIKGGHRVGISGSGVMEDGKIININHIYSLNFRIARQVIGSGNKVLKFVSIPGARKNNNDKRYCKTDFKWNKRNKVFSDKRRCCRRKRRNSKPF